MPGKIRIVYYKQNQLIKNLKKNPLQTKKKYVCTRNGKRSAEMLKRSLKNHQYYNIYKNLNVLQKLLAFTIKRVFFLFNFREFSRRIFYCMQFNCKM